MDTVKVGPLNMTRPAFVAFITAILVGALLVFKGQAHIGIIFMISGFVQAYTINCAMIGHCDAWAWVLSAAIVVGAIVAIQMVRNKKL